MICLKLPVATQWILTVVFTAVYCGIPCIRDSSKNRRGNSMNGMQGGGGRSVMGAVI